MQQTLFRVLPAQLKSGKEISVCVVLFTQGVNEQQSLADAWVAITVIHTYIYLQQHGFPTLGLGTTLSKTRSTCAACINSPATALATRSTWALLVSPLAAMVTIDVRLKQ